MRTVGIDAVEFWTGNLTLDLPGTFASVKDEDPEKYTKGLGLYASSFPDAYEDIVTMGANAAYRLMDRKDLAPEDIGRIDVATESAFDNSKPVSTYIAGCLEEVLGGAFKHADKGERKFACLAGTQCLNDAFNWIAAGRNRERPALVITTDTALYERGDAGEATQGAGAVAMLVDEDPDLVALSPSQGVGSADETDFLKPNQQFPSVDGQRSIQVYLARMREALEDYKSVAGDVHPDDLAYGPFHTPYPGMVRKAAVLAYRNTIRGTDLEAEIADEIGTQPLPEDFETEEEYNEAIAAQAREIAEAEGIEMTEDGLDALVYAAGGDMRRVINTLQAAATTGELVDEEAVYMITSTARPEEIEAMVTDAIEGDFAKARATLDTLLTDTGMAGGDIIDQLHRSVWDLGIEERAAVRLMERIGEADYRITEGANEQVQLEALLASLALEKN